MHGFQYLPHQGQLGPQLLGHGLAGAFVIRVQGMAEGGRVDVAEREFADVLRTQANNADALGGLGLVRLRRRLRRLAEEQLEEGVKP